MLVSVQVEPHSCLGEMQPLTAAHTPSLQYWPVAHALLQAPQCFGSFFASTHAMPHCRSELLQLTVQAPAVHTLPAAQALPQAPQCWGSTFRSTHEVPHAEHSRGGSPRHEQSRASASRALSGAGVILMVCER